LSKIFMMRVSVGRRICTCRSGCSNCHEHSFLRCNYLIPPPYLLCIPLTLCLRTAYTFDTNHENEILPPAMTSRYIHNRIFDSPIIIIWLV
jgi:hypothetical protein